VAEPFHKQTPLHWACKAGLPEYVHLFVMQGAHILAQDMHGWTAAHHAAANGMEELYDPLREGDADFDFPDLLGKSSLHIAAEYGNTEFG
jgi:ankyrin repeat protein